MSAQYDMEIFKQELEAAAGKRECDLILNNIRLVDVYTNEIRPCAIAIYNGKIVALNPGQEAKARQRIDGRGQYAVPGFIDSHIHIETTLLTPQVLSDIIAPWGTTTLMVDAMEIANVAGMDGLLALIGDTDELAFRVFLEIPSRVPTMPGYETTGGVLDVDEVNTLLKLPQTVSLGELDASKILDMKDIALEKILCALSSNKVCNGHAIGLGAKDLNTYAAGHLMDDHECVTYEDLINRLRVGIRVMLREGSSERNVRELMQGVLANGLSTENLLFCTDDKHANDISREGHISFNIQQSIDLGLNPIEAIKIASIHAARHFRMDHVIGSLTPGRYADIVLLEDLKVIRPTAVFKGGKPFYLDGETISRPLVSYPDKLLHTIQFAQEPTAQSFRIPCAQKQALCKVIAMIEDQIINEQEQAWLNVSGGSIEADVSRDILKLSVVERYGKNGNVKSAFVRGFGLKHGALASSVSHDHHNIVVVGTNDADMLAAVLALRDMNGGFVAVSDGKIIDGIALPLGGLMSLLPAAEVMAKMDALNASVCGMGCNMRAPFMSLSFVSLPTVPSLGLTDQGLVDVLAHGLTELVIETR